MTIKCKNCGCTIHDGDEYVGLKEKNFCSLDCAREYLLNNPDNAIDHYIEDFAQLYDHEFENPYV